MIGLGFYNVTQTTTDLNGPFLRFTSEPESSTVNDGGSVTFTGIATAEFKHNPTIPGERVTNTGAIAYQWYIDGVAAEDISGKISGAQTNELTLSNLVSPADNGKKVFLRAVYNGSAYQSESGAITAGIAASTGNGVNQPVDTDTSNVTINVKPTISIDTQPSDATAGQGINATFTVSASASDDSQVFYQWNQDGSPLSDSSTVSGANTPSLTISSQTLGDSSITVTVSHPTASNSPLTSDTATFSVVANRAIIKVYLVNETVNRFFEINLSGGSSGTLIGDQRFGGDGTVYTFHSTEDDIRVRMTLKAAAGRSYLSGGRGGIGGLGGSSTFDITLEKDVEYVLRLGGQGLSAGGGNQGGGGGAFLYKKGTLLVAIGGGGAGGRDIGSGVNRNQQTGGNGGGMGMPGESGKSPGFGFVNNGAQPFPDGTLPTIGVFQGGTVFYVSNTPDDPNQSNTVVQGTGGRVSACPAGSEYFKTRFSPCQDIGQSRFIKANGQVIDQTPIIQRGFKPEVISNRVNGGNGAGTRQSGGGSGAVGGSIGDNGQGGGGGAGYTNGEVTVVTRQGVGNNGPNAFATFTLLD
tara:strand:- start:1051 stop:2790 length:1740 start_codon:yes stop_codon:yes gene_type:complete